ncbi:Spy/CpxP family protein refolding chaperone [Candidatus Omnitrophota bacterium]
MKKVLCLIIIAVMVVGVSGEALANKGCTSGKHGGAHGISMDEKLMQKAHCMIMHKEELKLSDEQVTQIKDLKYATKKALITQNADIELAKLEVKKNLWADTINLEVVNPLIDKKYEAKKAKAKALVAASAQLQSILTAEQKTALKKLKKEIKCKA